MAQARNVYMGKRHLKRENLLGAEDNAYKGLESKTQTESSCNSLRSFQIFITFILCMLQLTGYAACFTELANYKEIVIPLVAISMFFAFVSIIWTLMARKKMKEKSGNIFRNGFSFLMVLSSIELLIVYIWWLTLKYGYDVGSNMEGSASKLLLSYLAFALGAEILIFILIKVSGKLGIGSHLTRVPWMTNSVLY
jgi:hypothetical protein